MLNAWIVQQVRGKKMKDYQDPADAVRQALQVIVSENELMLEANRRADRFECKRAIEEACKDIQAVIDRGIEYKWQPCVCRAEDFDGYHKNACPAAPVDVKSIDAKTGRVK